MYDKVLTESTDLISLNKIKPANQYLQLIISLLVFFINNFFPQIDLSVPTSFSTISSFWNSPYISRFRFAAFRLLSSISSPTLFLVSSNTFIWFSPSFCLSSICMRWFLFQQHVEEKARTPSLLQHLVPTCLRSAVIGMGQYDFAFTTLILRVSQWDHMRQLLKSLQRTTNYHQDKNKAWNKGVPFYHSSGKKWLLAQTRPRDKHTLVT